MKKFVFCLFLLLSNNLVFGKTFCYYTYFGEIDIDELNRQVVFDNAHVFNIYDSNEDPLRLYLIDSNSNKRMIEFKKSSNFQSIDIYAHQNNRFERLGNYRIMFYKEIDRSAYINNIDEVLFLPSIRELVVKSSYGGNWDLIRGDPWWLRDLDTRIEIVCKAYLNALQKGEYNMNDKLGYENFCKMRDSGDLNKLYNLLRENNIREAADYLFSIGLAFDRGERFLFYFDESSGKWINYILPYEIY